MSEDNSGPIEPASVSPESSLAVVVASDSRTLADLEKVIVTGLVEAGEALAQIRDAGLYKAEYKTFEAYCEQRWGFSRMRAHQLETAALVVTNVNNCLQGRLLPPTHESHTRELAKLPPEQQGEVWEEAVKAAPKGKPTADQIKAVVATRLPAKSPENPARGSKRKRVQRLVLPAATPPPSPSGVPAPDTAVNDDAPDSGTRAVTTCVAAFRKSLTTLCGTFSLLPEDFVALVRLHQSGATIEEYLEALGRRTARHEMQTQYDALPKKNTKEANQLRKEMNAADNTFKAFMAEIEKRARS